MKTGLTFLFLLTTSWHSWAEDSLFSIQIAATEAPNLTFFKESTGFESLYAEETESGLVRIKLGSYATREEAEQDLVNVKNKGFTDAFITTYTGQQLSESKDPAKSPIVVDEEISINEPKENKRLPPSSSPAWSKLTDEQKRNVVYVDGILHLHEGDKFIPLSDL